MKQTDIPWQKWLTAFVFVAALLLLYKALDNYALVMQVFRKLSGLLSPFITGLVVAYLLHIPCAKIESLLNRNGSVFLRRRSRMLSVLMLVLFALALLVTASSFMIPALTQSVKDLIAMVTSPYFMEMAQTYIDMLRSNILLNQINWDEIFQDFSLSNYLKELDLSAIGGYAAGAFSSIFNIFVTLVVAIYMLLDPTPFLGTVRRLGQIFWRENTLRTFEAYAKESNAIFYKFISCQILDACIVGIMSGIGFALMGVRYAVLLGLVMGFLNVIPYFGALFGAAIAFITTLFSGGLAQALMALIFLLVVQQIDSNLIVPRLMGRSLNLNPVVIMLAISIGGAYYGIAGMIFSVPVVAIIKILCGDLAHLIERRKE